MKKLTMLLISIMMIFVVIGCTNKTTEEVTTEPITQTAEKPEEKEFINVNWSIIIPDPETSFEGANVTIIMYDPSAYYQVSNYKDGQYESYIDAARKMGFTDIKHKSESNGNEFFYAYDKDHNYYLEVTLNGTNKLLDITCKAVSK